MMALSFVKLDNISFVCINLSSLATYICIRRFGFPNSAILIFLGGLSLNIYIIHEFFIGMFPSSWNIYMLFVLELTATILLSFVVKKTRDLLISKGISLLNFMQLSRRGL